MNFQLLEEAEFELVDSFRYYEKITPGLGIRFKNEVLDGFFWIQKNPTTLHLRKGLYRRLNLKVFPYSICYSIHQKTIWILAIQHHYRRPLNWFSRKVPSP